MKTIIETERVSMNLCSLYQRYGYSRYKMGKFEEYDLYVRNRDFLTAAGGGNPGVIRDGENGLVVPMKDPLAMANAILRLADSAPLRRKLSEGASAIYAESFTAEVMTRKTEEVYDRGLKEAHII